MRIKDRLHAIRRFQYTTMGFESNTFVAYFHFIHWTHISLGLHVDLASPNIEIHVPFGFFRIGIPSDRNCCYRTPRFGVLRRWG